MKATYKINANLLLELEAEKLPNLLKQISDIVSALEPEPCGKSKSLNTLPRVREIDGDSYYEMQCKDCWAVLQLGLNKKGGTLYKKRAKTDKDGRVVKEDGKTAYLSSNGWLKWNKNTKKME